jgi:hypothetical protein
MLLLSARWGKIALWISSCDVIVFQSLLKQHKSQKHFLQMLLHHDKHGSFQNDSSSFFLTEGSAWKLGAVGGEVA